MTLIMGEFDVPDGEACASTGSFQCDNYEETSNACYVFGQKISECKKCPECKAACGGA